MKANLADIDAAIARARPAEATPPPKRQGETWSDYRMRRDLWRAANRPLKLTCSTCKRDAGERPIVATKIDPVTGKRTTVARCRTCEPAASVGLGIGSNSADLAAARRRGAATGARLRGTTGRKKATP